jgi:hypothetical protein
LEKRKERRIEKGKERRNWTKERKKIR